MSMDVTTLFGNAPPPQRATPDKRFRILLLGDFGGESTWTRHAIDRDDIDDVFRALKIKITIDGDPQLPNLDVPLKELDDFHPDQLFENLELFASLRTRRRRLQNDKTFGEEADAILGAVGGDPAKPDPASAPVDPSDLLGQAIEQSMDEDVAGGPAVERIAQGSLSIDEYVRQVVAPYVVAKSDPRKQEFLDGVDQALTATMRRLLHHCRFRQLPV